MNKTERTMLSRKLLALALSIMMVFAMTSVPAKAEGPVTAPKVTAASFTGGEIGYTFYKGFNDHYYVASGSTITFTMEDGSSHNLHVRSGAYIRDGQAAKSMEVRIGGQYIPVVLRQENGGDVYVDYGTTEDSNFFSTRLYTKKTANISALEKLTLGKKSVNTGNIFTKYYIVDPSSLTSRQQTRLHSYTAGNQDTVLALYTVDGHRITFNDDTNDCNASIYYDINKGTTYILSLRTFSYSDNLSTVLATDDLNPVPAPKAVVPAAPAAPAVGSTVAAAGTQYKVTSASTVSLRAAKKGKTATIPATITVNGRSYAVTGIDKKAFKKSKTKTLIVKSKALTKKSVKGCLKGSKVKVVKIKVGKKKENKKFVKKYKKIFTKKICGKKVTVK